MGYFELFTSIELGAIVSVSHLSYRGGVVSGFETHVIHGGHRGRTGIATDVLAQVGPTTRAHHYDCKRRGC